MDTSDARLLPYGIGQVGNVIRTRQGWAVTGWGFVPVAHTPEFDPDDAADLDMMFAAVGGDVIQDLRAIVHHVRFCGVGIARLEAYVNSR